MATVTVAASIIVATIPARAVINDAQLLKDAERVFKPLPRDAATPDFPITPERVELGRMLFFDPRVSLDGTVSCSRCHLAALFGTDGLPTAVQIVGKWGAESDSLRLGALLEQASPWAQHRPPAL